jgi:hypothetical protein
LSQDHHRDHLLGVFDLQGGSHRCHHLFCQGFIDLEGLESRLSKQARLNRKAEGGVNGCQHFPIKAQFN